MRTIYQSKGGNGMKAKIKATGEIINIADYAKVTLDKCDSWGNPIELGFDEVEILQEPTSAIDWGQRRYEIAKTILHAIYIDDGNAERADTSGLGFEYKDLKGSAQEAVRFADALIAELKKGGTQ
jgi:hypothetical protein